MLPVGATAWWDARAKGGDVRDVCHEAQTKPASAASAPGSYAVAMRAVTPRRAQLFRQTAPETLGSCDKGWRAGRCRMG